MQNEKRQFKSSAKPYEFYDRKVIYTGSSRLLSLTKLIPKEWIYVRITPVNIEDDYICVVIHKLMDMNDLAQLTDTNQTDKQDA